MNEIEFLRNLATQKITHAERAVALIWFNSLTDPSSGMTIAEICRQIENAGYGKQNSTRLVVALRKDTQTVKGSSDTIRINPKSRADLEKKYIIYTNGATQIAHEKIYDALLQISEPLANCYAQVKMDINDQSRLSWVGTAHEIRHLISILLQKLAPDVDVISQSWYEQDKNTSGPTQRQRVRYILGQHNAGSKEQKVTEQIVNLDEMVERLVRAIYCRASDAAHRFKSREEIIRILRYFDAFAHDLLNLS